LFDFWLLLLLHDDVDDVILVVLKFFSSSICIKFEQDEVIEAEVSDADLLEE
jgi:hypothetical protein